MICSSFKGYWAGPVRRAAQPPPRTTRRTAIRQGRNHPCPGFHMVAPGKQVVGDVFVRSVKERREGTGPFGCSMFTTSWFKKFPDLFDSRLELLPVWVIQGKGLLIHL